LIPFISKDLEFSNKRLFLEVILGHFGGSGGLDLDLGGLDLDLGVVSRRLSVFDDFGSFLDLFWGVFDAKSALKWSNRYPKMGLLVNRV